MELVNASGQIVAKASSKRRPAYNNAVPWISVTASRVYFLDGPSVIRWLKPDGTTGLATTIAIRARQQVSFAVSSDDKRLAVSVLSYDLPPSCGSPCLQPPPFLGTQLTVGELAGGKRTTIFTSATLAEVPVGWNQGNLLVGVALKICCQGVEVNPFSISEYHVVNPANGKRISTVCPPPRHSLGHPQPVGILCGTGRQNSPLSLQGWNGQSTRAGTAPSDFGGEAFLSPDGQRLALSGSGVTAEGSGVTIQRIDGSFLHSLPLGRILGWLDSDHLAAVRYVSETGVWILVDLRKTADGLDSASTPLPEIGVVGVFPGGLG